MITLKHSIKYRGLRITVQPQKSRKISAYVSFDPPAGPPLYTVVGQVASCGTDSSRARSDRQTIRHLVGFCTDWIENCQGLRESISRVLKEHVVLSDEGEDHSD